MVVVMITVITICKDIESLQAPPRPTARRTATRRPARITEKENNLLHYTIICIYACMCMYVYIYIYIYIYTYIYTYIHT